MPRAAVRRVQGAGTPVLREAVARDVAGWVRNRMDGTVEAVFEGPAAIVAQCVAWCRLGPPAPT